jgi:hypothetical protein
VNENQDYIHYRKGSIVMYSLKDYLGQAQVDKTLARYDHDKAFQQAPYTTTREFLAYLREDAGAQNASLITDLFEKITIFDDRVAGVTAKKRDDGKYDVTLSLHAGKTYVDGIGKETKATFDVPVDIGVFAKSPDGQEQNEKVLYLEKRMVADGDSSVTVTVRRRTVRSRHRSVQQSSSIRVSDDNRMHVTVAVGGPWPTSSESGAGKRAVGQAHPSLYFARGRQLGVAPSGCSGFP